MLGSNWLLLAVLLVVLQTLLMLLQKRLQTFALA
jgi:hypothetical protein